MTRFSARTSCTSNRAATVPREVPEDADGALDARIPRMSAVDTDEVAQPACGREHRPGRDADAGRARLGRERPGVDRFRQFAPQEKTAPRPRQTNAGREALDDGLRHARDLLAISLAHAAQVTIVAAVLQELGDGERRQQRTDQRARLLQGAGALLPPAGREIADAEARRELLRVGAAKDDAVRVAESLQRMRTRPGVPQVG